MWLDSVSFEREALITSQCRGYFLRMEVLCKADPESWNHIQDAQAKTVQSHINYAPTASFSSRVNTFKISHRDVTTGQGTPAASNNTVLRPAPSGSGSVPVAANTVHGGGDFPVNVWKPPATQASYGEGAPARKVTRRSRGGKAAAAPATVSKLSISVLLTQVYLVYS